MRFSPIAGADFPPDGEVGHPTGLSAPVMRAGGRTSQATHPLCVQEGHLIGGVGTGCMFTIIALIGNAACALSLCATVPPQKTNSCPHSHRVAEKTGGGGNSACSSASTMQKQAGLTRLCLPG